MGRKAKYGDPKAIKGPGRKARKQGDPVLPRSLQVKGDRNEYSDPRQKKRFDVMKKRPKRNNKFQKDGPAFKKQKVVAKTESEDESDPEYASEEEPMDDSKFKTGMFVKQKRDILADDSDGEAEGTEEKDEDDQEPEEQEENDNDSDEGGDSDDDDNDDDDLLPIERESKKLQKKYEEEK
ncbi:GSCOCG00010108001-RA-CDS [Cotesia congregata]|nr:GSCOCG00010108001-RA-CDS [Cotesia congregata]